MAILVSGSAEDDEESAAYIQQGVRYLEGIQQQNHVAQGALHVLKQLTADAFTGIEEVSG